MDPIITNIDSGEVRPFRDHGQATVANAGGLALAKSTFEPGWRWSTDLAPITGTSSCQIHHLGYVLAGRMHVVMDDGAELELGPGDLFDLPAGHDAWVVGDEPVEMVDYSVDATRYARRAEVSEDTAMQLVRRGYAAFNSGDMDTLRQIFARDVVHHAPGSGPLAGTYKGVDSVLGYYAKIAELTDGTFRANLVDVHGDRHGHVVAIQLNTATRKDQRMVSRVSIVFTFVGEKATDLLELHADLDADDAFLSA